MEIASITGFRYELPLTAPLQLDAHTLTTRAGILVCVTTSSGEEGWGDVAPLPGFSPESLDEAEQTLHGAVRLLSGRSVTQAIALVGEEIEVSSVRFGLELALFDAQAKASGTSLPHGWCEAPRLVVPLNALLTRTGEAVLDEAERLRAAGYRAVKLKVGRQPVADDVALVRCVSARLDGVALRLDANRAWSLDEARVFAEGIAGVPIDYVEEPLADAAALPRFAAETDLPLALDETVQGGASPAAHPYARAVVIKPTLVGGIVSARRLAQRAAEQGITPVLSASFESGVGLRGLIALAACVGMADVPVGLSTYRWLDADVLRPRLPLDGPEVDVDAALDDSRQLDADVLRHERLLFS